jgi:mono/diheme cytochrome c family protein
MTRWNSAFVLGAALPLALVLSLTRCATAQQPQQANASAGGMSVLRGAFTAEQAQRGEARFAAVCSTCHSTFEFSGIGFQRAWAGRTLGDFYERISTSMPMDNPGSLTPQEYTDILGYFLKLNDYPAGPRELPADTAVLVRVRIERIESGQR